MTTRCSTSPSTAPTRSTAQLRLIKGGGGALLREKIVATASERMIVIADASKHVESSAPFRLPVEVVRFGVAATRNMIETLAAMPAARARSACAWARTASRS